MSVTSESQSAHQPKLPRVGSKLHTILKQLQAKNGTTLNRMGKATGWQAHTVRAALSGLRKRGFIVTCSKRNDGAAVYAVGKE